MIRWFLLPLLILCAPSYAQEAGVVASQLDGNSILATAAGNTASGTHTRNLTHIMADTQMVRTIKVGGGWTGLDSLIVFANEDTSHALVNYKDASTVPTVTGTLTFTADNGYTCSGSTSNYVDSGKAMSGLNYAQDNASMWASIGTNVGETRADVGGSSSSQEIGSRGTGNQYYTAANATADTSLTNTSSIGTWGWSRDNSANYVSLQFARGGSITETTITKTSSGVGTGDFLGCKAGVISSTKLLEVMANGASMVTAARSAIANAITTRVGAVGAP